MITMSILGVKNTTVQVPQVKRYEVSPQQVMHKAQRRYASYGAEKITLVPCRGGKGSGWEKKDDV